MTPCLGPDEFVDLLEGQLPAARAAHVEACPSCREQFAWLQGSLRDARDVPVPEPSPLFWDHLAARVRTAIAAEEAPAPRRDWWQLPVLGPALGLAAVVALLVTTVGRVSPVLVDPVLRLAADLRDDGAVAADEPLDELDVPDADTVADAGDPLVVPGPAMEVMAPLVADLDWDQLAEAGLGVQPGTADAAFDTFTPQERDAVVRALRDALEGPES